MALHQQGQLAQARAIYEQIVKAQPGHADALHLLGVIAAQTNHPQRAVELIGRAIAVQPGNAAFHSNLGYALILLRRFDEALASYDRTIAIKPDHSDAHFNRGNALMELKRPGEALASYDKAIGLRPGDAAAHSNRGNALRGLRRLEEALASYDRAIALLPDYADAYINRGNALNELRRHEEALASYAKASALRPDSPDTYYNQGLAHEKLKQYDQAALFYRKAYALDPDYPFLAGVLLHAMMLACAWQGLDELYESVKSGLLESRKVAYPFGFQAICDSEALLQRCAQIYARHYYPAAGPRRNHRKDASRQKIRIGYLCGEFREQATSLLMTQAWELHDKEHFDIIAFDNGWDDHSVRRQRIVRAFDEFLDITRMSDAQAAAMIEAKGVDILVNLNGYFGEERQGIFALRPGPVQVNYLGFPGTIGADYMDYLICDEVVIPAESRRYYNEKLAYLPHTYQANDATRPVSERVFRRPELGLPERGFVFCCFNNNYKITPAQFDTWMRVLARVDGSVLWLLEDTPVAAKNLRHEASRRGVDPERLVFAGRMPQPEHLARHRVADLFLDTLPYNAHTTASDALWAGLPVLTCIGTTFPGRVAASLLKAIGLPELIAGTPAEYEAMAIELAADPQRLAALRETLAHNRLTAPLFDTPHFTRHIEAAYRAMHERYRAGLPPDHLFIAP